MAAFLSSFPAGTHVPSAVLDAAARSGARFVVVGSAGGRSKAVAAALHAATKGRGLVLSSAVVARAAKISGEVEDSQGDDRTGKDGFLFGADDKLFGFGAGKRTGEEEFTNDDKVYVFGAGEDSTGEEVLKDGIKAEKEVVIYGSDEMTMEELVVMFQKETAILLKNIKQFPMKDDDTVLDSLIASCDAIGDMLKKDPPLLDKAEGRRIVNTLIALHLRIVSCVGEVVLFKPGSYMPDMWAGNRHRLPRKAKLAGTLMEILLYSMMLAAAALGPYVSPPVWNFTGLEGAGPEVEEAD